MPTAANDMNISAAGLVNFDGTKVFSGVTTTQYNALIGSTANGITNVIPTATSGVPLISQGSAANPIFGTAVVAGGGTGNATQAAYSLVCGGTSTTGAFQAVADVATGSVLVSGGTSALPAFSATPTVTSITFGAGNALNTYVQGTWTPALKFGGASVGLTYNAQSGEYTQIGNIVFIVMRLILSAVGSSTGNATITGLPVTTGGTINQSALTIQNGFSFTSTYVDALASMPAGGTTINLFQTSYSLGTAPLTNSNFVFNTGLTIATFYFTS